MQIVIDIPEERFNDIKRIAQVISYRRLPALEKVIANGTPLPEGHGRLIDADALKQVYENTEDAEVCKWTLYGVTSEIDDAETIIEADKAESEE